MDYQICKRCVMDTSDSEIEFDENGICNHCKTHEERVLLAPFSHPDSEQRLVALVEKIKSESKGEYDCIVGLSGGVDSSYVAYQAVKLGLRPLAIHFDNGWNSELAVKNIEKLVKQLNLDLITYVIDWEEFRDIQRSFFNANVVDIEMVTDHAIFAALFKLAKQHRVRYILSGTNAATESIMPLTWQHFKFDLLNLKSIHKKFGNVPIVSFPTMSIWKMAWNRYIAGFRSVPILNYLKYSKKAAIETLENELDWEYYGGKHFESVFTKYYQAHILPTKFNIDKRRIHLSDLIMNEEITRDEAMQELARPLYDKAVLQQDQDYVCKKLGFTRAEHEHYLAAAPVSHFSFPSYARLANALVAIYRRRAER